MHGGIRESSRERGEELSHGDFFFSSRRRHTRLQGDWSSDVCSSDLSFEPKASIAHGHLTASSAGSANDPAGGAMPSRSRSEERRVGKEGRSRWSPYH